jgi:hypothetical protein
MLTYQIRTVSIGHRVVSLFHVAKELIVQLLSQCSSVLRAALCELVLSLQVL